MQWDIISGPRLFFSHHKLSFFDSLGTYSLLWMLMVTRLPSCYFYSQAGFSGQPENVLVTDAQWANECKAVSQESCHGKRPQLSLTCRVVWGFLFYLFIYFYRQDHVITPSPPWSSDHIARYQLCNNLKYFSGNTPPPAEMCIWALSPFFLRKWSYVSNDGVSDSMILHFLQKHPGTLKTTSAFHKSRPHCGKLPLISKYNQVVVGRNVWSFMQETSISMSPVTHIHIHHVFLFIYIGYS